MGMTNRVIPAQGEERGASYTLIWLDGDTSQKFQPFRTNFLMSDPGGGREFCLKRRQRAFMSLN